ncbi:ABC transporter, ATP-binding protein [Ancylostoma ceylanicum]|uniref:ABC transporter, ATP-binding protein n=1 Tax=Ancylostoma ceylanicum TaxID=53326 RepID=A0A0D6L9Y6_9BILA|nr:ABC transporter, ATP-binding protein [Ancylostoma ceylanicum]
MKEVTDQFLSFALLNQIKQANDQCYRSRSWWIVLAVDFAVGLALFLYVDCDKAYDVFWKNVDELVDKLDGVITWLTNNPAGLKLNEPVNTALASFFQYHIHLWKTFMLFSRYRIIWHVLCGSSCMGLSVCCALFADFFSLLTLHIVCFDVYESRGAGKTTLLNTLLSRNLKGLTVEGTVAVNGNVIGRGITAISGYAQQEEMFVGTLTVREYLSIQARLRTNLPPERREKRVNVVLSQLGLTKCQNTRIGVAGVLKGISGGEARRLTFACEMLSNPALLFCDEPTTGLDSFMAENVVQVLSKLAKSGRTVVCTIHQPASQLYLMFDRVMFLDSSYPCWDRQSQWRSLLYRLRAHILDLVWNSHMSASYYLARILSYIPLFSVDGLLMLYVCYWMVGFSSSVSQVLFATLIAFLIEQSSSAFGVMLSCISPTYPVAASLAGPLLTLLSLTGGLYANVGSLPSYVSWIQYLSWFRYGFEALAINQWEEVNGANSTFWNDQV